MRRSADVSNIVERDHTVSWDECALPGREALMILAPPASDTDRIVADILAQVADGRLTPGRWLPSIGELASTYDVGVTTVKSALRDLRTRGVVLSAQGKGTWIAGQPPARRH
jgi:GntR family transcriptional regulator